MDIQFKKMVGQTEFTFNVQAENLKDFFEKVSVYEDIPIEGPNGEKDLKISFRTTKEGHKYYSVVCESAKKEFKFGQSKDNITMFPKGWEPLFIANNNDNNTQQQGGLAQQATPTPAPDPVPQQNVKESTPSENNSAVNDVLAKYGIGQ